MSDAKRRSYVKELKKVFSQVWQIDYGFSCICEKFESTEMYEIHITDGTCIIFFELEVEERNENLALF